MEVVVLSDSHLTKGIDAIGDQVLDAVTNADVVLHAGDITSRQAFEELEVLAETYAVLGNNDHDLVGVVPKTRLLTLDGVRIGLIHDSGPTKGRAVRLHRHFPDAHLVVFGHSHIPVDALGEQDQVLFNPGSPTQRRAQPRRTFGRLHLFEGQILHREVVIVS